MTALLLMRRVFAMDRIWWRCSSHLCMGEYPDLRIFGRINKLRYDIGHTLRYLSSSIVVANLLGTEALNSSIYLQEWTRLSWHLDVGIFQRRPAHRRSQLGRKVDFRLRSSLGRSKRYVGGLGEATTSDITCGSGPPYLPYTSTNRLECPRPITSSQLSS